MEGVEMTEMFGKPNDMIYSETGYHHSPSIPMDPLNNAIGYNSVVSHQRKRNQEEYQSTPISCGLGITFREANSPALWTVKEPVCRVRAHADNPRVVYLGWACLKALSDRGHWIIGKLRSYVMTLMAPVKKKEEP